MHYVLSACVVARKLSGIELAAAVESLQARAGAAHLGAHWRLLPSAAEAAHTDRKSTHLNSSHLVISYAVFCLKKHTIPEQHLDGMVAGNVVQLQIVGDGVH